MTTDFSRKTLLVAAISMVLTACGRQEPPPAVESQSQPLFMNGGFEDGNLNGWTTSVYWNNGIIYPPTSYAQLQLQTCPHAGSDCTNRTSVKTNPTPESQQMTGLAGLVSPRWPKFNTATAVVNEQGYLQNVNTLKQSYATTSADVDSADGKIHVRFALSPQLQNPGHAATQQPYFYAILRNTTKTTVLYQTFNYSNEPGVPWQTYTGGAVPVVYTDWVVFDIAPGNAALQIGDTVEVEIVAAGCQPNGHWGQVFVDGFGAQLPSISIAKTGPQFVNANADLTYSFLAKNATSLVARDVVAEEVTPTNTTFQSIVPPAGVTCTTPAVGGTGTISCPLGWMNPQSSATFEVTVHVNAGVPNGTIITNANYSIGGNGITAMLGSKVQTTVGAAAYADLSIAVTDGIAAIGWGQPLSYTITVSNDGPNAVTGALVNDTFPVQLTGVTWACAGSGGGSCTTPSGSGNITNRLVTLPVGASAIFTVSATVVAGSGSGSLNNSASVTAPAGTTDSDTRNNTDADLDGIGTLWTLTLNKDFGETGRGQVVSSPTAINCGDACASQSAGFLNGTLVSLTAIARPGDTFTGWTGCTSGSNVCNFTISAGTTVTAHFRGPTVTGSAPSHGNVICAPSPVAQGSSSTCTIYPDIGYELVALTDNGVDVFALVLIGTYTVTSPVIDHSVVAGFLKVNGTACTANNQCTNGQCVDGVCCDSACGGQCEACNLLGSEGTCSPATGAPVGGRTACATDGTMCGGACNGVLTTACTYPASECRAASCSSGTGTLAASCNGAGGCPAIQTVACTPYVCGPTACYGACTTDAQCIVADWCSAGACVPKLANGASCTANDQCTNGQCVDGVCCNSACGGQCEACNLLGSVGTCSPATGAPVGGRTACATDGTTCGGACNGALTTACTYPASECRAASCSSGTGTLAASCNGAGACPTIQTVACTPYVCGPTACYGSCTTDAQCIAADWCSVDTCVPKLANGGACTANNQCTNGQCVDGVCCDSACGGQCEACNLLGSQGTCSPATGAPVGGRTACATDGTMCGGACNGALTTACTYPASECRAASCSSGTGTLAASCNGAGACPEAETETCSPYVCSPTACLVKCSVDGECVAGYWCSGEYCLPQLADGQLCDQASQCLSDRCVDGVCCNAACDGQCEACNLVGSEGTCSPATGAPVGGRTACVTDGTMCGGACNGTLRNVCAYPGDTVSCRDPSCTSDVATLGEACDGAGACPPIQTQSCDPYVCGPTACVGDCTTDSDCVSGNWCSAGMCVPKYGNGTACGSDNQCVNGHCTDGVCCDAACGGQCEACNISGLVGTCSPASGAPAGARPACQSDGSICGGACDGALRTACVYPGKTDECRAASCTSGIGTLTAACDGAGRCPLVQTQVCAPYICGPDACLGNCNVDGDCDTGMYCSAGVCVDKLVDGDGCSGANQCVSDHCVDGVCCDTACDGQCEACNSSGFVGSCSPATGAPVGTRPACSSDGTICAGACNGTIRNACAYPDGVVECRAASCDAGAATLAAACNGAGGCPSLQQQTCAPFVCGPSACLGNCLSEADCAEDNWCSAGVCVAKLGPGEVCGAAVQCASGYCVDGVCCDGACTDQCGACDVPDHAGTCTAVTGPPHGARTACVTDGTTCGGVCDGAGRTACAYSGDSTVCGAASCADGVALAQEVCDGTGTCPARETTSCGNYGCDGSACATSCTSDETCAAGYVCDNGICVPASTGWHVSGSGGCSSSGGPTLAPLALLALLLLQLRRRRRAGRGAALLAFLALALPGSPRAQSTTSIDVQRFQPLGGAYDLLAVPSARVPGHLDAKGFVFVDYASRPLVLVPDGGGASVPLVASMTSLTLGGSLGLFDRLELALVAPIVLAASGRPADSAVPTLSSSVPKSSLGDLRISPKVLIAETDRLAFAVVVPVTVPTANSAYVGQKGVTVSPRAVAEYGKAWRVAANVGVVLRSKRELLNLEQRTAAVYGVAGGVPFPIGEQRLTAIATLAGEIGRGWVERPLELLAALRWQMPIGLAFTVGGGPGITHGYGTPRYRLLASVDLAAAAPKPAPEPALPPPPVVEPAPEPPPPEPPPVVEAPPEPAPPPAPAPPPEPPPGTKVVLKKNRIVILEQVHFATNRDVILEDSFDLLGQVAKVLSENAQITKVRVEGHTDSRGKAKHNLDLSRRRARNVREFLIRKGIDGGRLESQGYGAEQPIVDNSTKEGRAKNRRVELVIVSQEK